MKPYPIDLQHSPQVLQGPPQCPHPCPQSRRILHSDHSCCHHWHQNRRRACRKHPLSWQREIVMPFLLPSCPFFLDDVVVGFFLVSGIFVPFFCTSPNFCRFHSALGSPLVAAFVESVRFRGPEVSGFVSGM